MYPFQESRALAKARTANSTDASYPAKAPTTTAPSSDGVVAVSDGAAPASPQTLLVLPYLLGNNNGTFSVRVIGWDLASTLWVPKVLAEYDCTAGNVTGVAAADVLDTEFFADTLSLVANMGTNAEGTTKVSPQDDTPGHFLVQVRGCRKVEFLFKKGTGTSANALYRAY
jgi:hypothetical protein